jgi:hypothetical protein
LQLRAGNKSKSEPGVGRGSSIKLPVGRGVEERSYLEKLNMKKKIMNKKKMGEN